MSTRLPKVTVTALSVGGSQPLAQRVSVAVLSSASGRSRTAQCASDNRQEKRWAMLSVVAQSLAALQRPAHVKVVCNDRRALIDMKQAAHRSELGGPHAAHYAAYAAAAEAHDRVPLRPRRGDGRAGQGCLPRGTAPAGGVNKSGVASWRIVTGIV